MPTAQAESATAAIQETADRLYLSARRHKRAEADHRRQAREDMQTLARLEAMCKDLGIKLVVNRADR